MTTEPGSWQAKKDIKSGGKKTAGSEAGKPGRKENKIRWKDFRPRPGPRPPMFTPPCESDRNLD